MTQSKLLLALACSAAALSACSQPVVENRNAAVQADTAADEQAIRGHINRWLQHITARDSAAIARFYADDGVVMPPGQPLSSGRESVQRFWQSMFEIPEFNLTFSPERIEFSRAGDMALDRGTYRFTGRPGGQAVDETGKYVVVWKKVGGEWKVAADIFNSDRPAAGG